MSNTSTTPDPEKFTMESASSEELMGIIKKIEAAIIGEREDRAVMALLALTIVIMRPEITNTQLATGIERVSREICLLAAEDDLVATAEVSKSMN